MKNDPFDILGLPHTAGPDEVKKAFRKLAKRYHPDITGGSDAVFRRILLAYQQLADGGEMPTGEDETYDYYMKVELDRKRHKIQDVFDDLKDGLLAFFDLDAPEYLDFFIGLSPGEATRGGRLKLDLPLVRTCRSCMGTGKPFFATCKKCGGTGEEVYRKAVYIDIPAEVDDGWQTRLHIDNLHLTVVLKKEQQGSDV
jgi:DnaJ-class molecular chaperone